MVGYTCLGKERVFSLDVHFAEKEVFLIVDCFFVQVTNANSTTASTPALLCACVTFVASSMVARLR